MSNSSDGVHIIRITWALGMQAVRVRPDVAVTLQPSPASAHRILLMNNGIPPSRACARSGIPVLA